MIRSFVTLAFRNFSANKITSLIHVLGLAIGISASLIVFLIIRYEQSFNNVGALQERLYRVVMDFKFGDVSGHGSAVPAPLAAAVDNEISGVESTVPVMHFQGDGTVKVEVPSKVGDPFIIKNQPKVVFTNPDYFKILPYNWIVGSAETALRNPFSVVLCESRAHQYFPGVDLHAVAGREITYNDEVKVFVTGVVKDFEAPSDFSFSEFLSYSTIAKTNLQQNFMMDIWHDWMAYSSLYVVLGNGSDPNRIEGQLGDVLKKHQAKTNSDMSMKFRLQPVNDIHFNPDYAGFNQRVANRQTLSGLLAIAVFLLLLACINFTNLATAQAGRRAKEIGIRKTIGSSRKLLVFQFLSETFFTTLIAALVSISITPLALELFSDFMPPGLTFPIASDPFIFLFLISLVFIVTLLSGAYPAFVLSGFRPVKILKNSNVLGTKSSGIRKALTVSQFVVAQFFIIGAFMVAKQIHYSLNQDLGYRKEAIINFALPRDTVADHREKIRNSLASIPQVELVSIGFLPPAMEGAAFGNISFKKESGEEVKVNVQVRWGDPDYINVYKIKLAAGRNIRPGTDIEEALINESYARELGFVDPNEVIGKELKMGDDNKSTIVGVMRDFHESSTHAHIGPIVFRSRGDGNFMHVALLPQNQDGTAWQNAIAQIEKTFKSVYPQEDFNYSFFDDSIQRFYIAEQKMSKLLNWATALSMLISCLGLLGLVMYTVQSRTKEIGMRKILGASVSAIISLLSLEFIRLVVLAFVIAAPIAWWATHQWLETFAYRTSMDWWVFGMSGLVLLLVAVITMSAYTIRTALENPTKNLRTE